MYQQVLRKDNYEFYRITGMMAPPKFMRFLPVNKRKLTAFWYMIDRAVNKKSESRKKGTIIRRGFSYIPFPILFFERTFC